MIGSRVDEECSVGRLWGTGRQEIVVPAEARIQTEFQFWTDGGVRAAWLKKTMGNFFAAAPSARLTEWNLNEDHRLYR